MTAISHRNDKWCGNLRITCLIIGYLNLMASIVDMACHLTVVAIVSKGFQCDADNRRLVALLNGTWLDPILLILNLGTHGFYPFPLIVTGNVFMPVAPEPKCYPGMIHLNMMDILNFTINGIWMNYVISYVSALHKKDAEPIRKFIGISAVKLTLTVFYFIDYSDLTSRTIETYWFLKVLDICIATIFLFTIYKYLKVLRSETDSVSLDHPPSYVECVNICQDKENKDPEVITVLEDKKGQILYNDIH